MSKIDRDSLLKFLSIPRFAHEVAEHYGVSKKLASFHLRKAIESGHVLMSERPVFQIARDPIDMTRKLSGVAYIFRNSPVLSNGWARFGAKMSAPSINTAPDALSIKFVPKRSSSPAKRLPKCKPQNLASEETDGSGIPVDRLKLKDKLRSEFGISTPKVRLGKRKTIGELLEHRTRSATPRASSLSQVEKIRLFQALLKAPLSFLDIHGRFGVSKQVVRGFTKNGLLQEVWGPESIGLRFKLTGKGKIHLRELEAAAKTGSRIKKTTLVRLKDRVPL